MVFGLAISLLLRQGWVKDQAMGSSGNYRVALCHTRCLCLLSPGRCCWEGPSSKTSRRGSSTPHRGHPPLKQVRQTGVLGFGVLLWVGQMRAWKKKIIQTATYPWKLCKKRGTQRAFPTAEVPAPIAKWRPSPGAPSWGTAVLLSVRAPHSFHWPWRKFLSTWIKGPQFSYLMPGGTSPSPRWRPVIKLLLPCRPSPQYCQANI